MTAPKTKHPLSSFGPELMTVLVKGSRERIVLRFDGPDGAGKRKAHKFQQRIHTLRSRMRQENHPDYHIAARAVVSLFWGPKAVLECGDAAPADWAEDHLGKRGALIVIRPKDSEFDDILRQAGVSVTKAEPAKPYITIDTSADEEAALDNFMDELTKKDDDDAPIE